MSYEWFANTFPMRAFWGFNEGSTYERVNGYVPTAVGQLSMLPGVGLLSYGAGYANYGNVLDITDTTRPFTFAFDTQARNMAAGARRRFFAKLNGGSAVPGYEIQYLINQFLFVFGTAANQLVVYVDTSALVALPGQSRITGVITYDGSLLASGVRIYLNGRLGALVTVTNTLIATSAANPSDLVLNGTGVSTRRSPGTLSTMAWIDAAVDGAQASRIYEHLRTERPARIHPRRKFSIPMPLRTQPVELAAGYIWAAAGGMAGGRWPDLVQGVRNAARVGPIDVAAHGVFDQCVVNNYVAGGSVPAGSLTLPVGDTDIFNSNDWTFSCWLMVPVASAAVRKVLQLDGTNYYIALDAAEKIVVSNVNGAAAQVTTTSTAPLITGKWYHLLVSRQMVVTDMRTRILLDGTIDTDSTAAGIGVTLPGAGAPRLAAGGMSIDALRYRKNFITSDGDARTECLQGGKQVLFDGRLCRTGCCPVMPVAATAPNFIGPWSLDSATCQMVEEPPNGAVLGKRSIRHTAVSSYHLVTRNPVAPFGSYYWRVKPVFGDSQVRFLFAQSGPGQFSTVGQTGYVLYIAADESVVLLRVAFPATVAIASSAAGYVARGTWYEFWLERYASGTFFLRIRGGAYADWTTVFFAINELTYTSGLSWMSLNNNRNSSQDENGDVVQYRTAMTTTEAIALGILEP